MQQLLLVSACCLGNNKKLIGDVNSINIINTIAARGLEELFSSCVVVSVFGSGGKQVLVLHTYVLRVQYSCGVVLVFFGLAGNSFWCYLRT